MLRLDFSQSSPPSSTFLLFLRAYSLLRFLISTHSNFLWRLQIFGLPGSAPGFFRPFLSFLSFSIQQAVAFRYQSKMKFSTQASLLSIGLVAPLVSAAPFRRAADANTMLVLRASHSLSAGYTGFLPFFQSAIFLVYRVCQCSRATRDAVLQPGPHEIPGLRLHYCRIYGRSDPYRTIYSNLDRRSYAHDCPHSGHYGPRRYSSRRLHFRLLLRFDRCVDYGYGGTVGREYWCRSIPRFVLLSAFPWIVEQDLTDPVTLRWYRRRSSCH